MATQGEIAAATKNVAEKSETLMGASGSKLEEDHVPALDVSKGGAGSATVAVHEEVVRMETVVETTFVSCSEFERGLGGEEKGNPGVENASGRSNVGTSVVVNGIDEKVEDGKGSSVDNGDGSFGDFEELNGNGGEVLHQTVDGDEKEGENGEKLEDQNHTFCVGDIVWGKIKSHPWWPGQIYDPKDASRFAVKHRQEGRLLVAFFGDGSCSWCSPMQLAPFLENFAEMSANSSAKSFLNALEKALDEIGRLMESEMACKCIPDDKKIGIARPEVANAGLKSGVLRPEVEFDQLSITKYEPDETVDKVKQLAKTLSFGGALDLVVLRSWLAAYYRFKGGYELCRYHVPFHVEGLEDKNDDGTEVANDFTVRVEVPTNGPQDDIWLSSPKVGSTEKVFHRRKQKSVSELMGENTNVNPNSQKREKVKKAIEFVNSSSHKRKKNSDGVEGDESGGTGKTGKKRKVEVPEPSKITNVEDLNAENAVMKPMEIEVDDEKESEMLSSPRERKRSKYLSPPYTIPTWRTGYSIYKMEPEIKSDKITKKATSDEKLPNGKLEKSVNRVSETSENDNKKMTFSISDVDVPVNELLSEIKSAAVDPFYLSRKGSLDMVWDFMYALRSSTYLHGSDCKIFNKCKRGGTKTKSLDDISAKKAKSPEHGTPKLAKSEGKLKKLEQKVLPRLILSFAPEFPLPSKEDIVKIYGEFGGLDKKKTKVMKDSHSIQVIYMEDSDAEAAFKSSMSRSPFGPGNVNYKLQHGSRSSRKSIQRVPSSSPSQQNHAEADDLVSDISVIRRKFELMEAIMENYQPRFSEEERSSLKDEMKHLMKEVESASDKVRAIAESYLS